MCFSVGKGRSEAVGLLEFKKVYAMVHEVLWLCKKGRSWAGTVFGTPVSVNIGNVKFLGRVDKLGRAALGREPWHWHLEGILHISHAFLPTLKPKSQPNASLTTLTKSRNGSSLGSTSYRKYGPYLGILRAGVCTGNVWWKWSNVNIYRITVYHGAGTDKQMGPRAPFFYHVNGDAPGSQSDIKLAQ